jgi:hypothetical protein
MKNFSTSWKTTLGGGVTAAIGIASLFGVKVGAQTIDPTTALGMITGGVGLIFAKDGNVTGGSVQQ